jgi:hypothetical protein
LRREPWSRPLAKTCSAFANTSNADCSGLDDYCLDLSSTIVDSVFAAKLTLVVSLVFRVPDTKRKPAHRYRATGDDACQGNSVSHSETLSWRDHSRTGAGGINAQRE